MHAVAVAKQHGMDIIIDGVLNVCRVNSTVIVSGADQHCSIRYAVTGRKNF